MRTKVEIASMVMAIFTRTINHLQTARKRAPRRMEEDEAGKLWGFQTCIGADGGKAAQKQSQTSIWGKVVGGGGEITPPAKPVGEKSNSDVSDSLFFFQKARSTQPAAA